MRSNRGRRGSLPAAAELARRRHAVAHGQCIGAINLVSMLLIAQAVAKTLVEQATASASLSMPTVNGMTGQADYADYNAWKAAVLLKTMTVEFVSSRLRAIFVCASHSETSLNWDIVGNLGGRHFADAMPAENNPLAKAGGLRNWSARTSSSIRPGVAHNHTRVGCRRESHCDGVNQPEQKPG
jgi:hypothetical protein